MLQHSGTNLIAFEVVFDFPYGPYGSEKSTSADEHFMY